MMPRAKLQKAKSDGRIRAFTGNDYDDLVSETAALWLIGDVLQLQKDSPQVRFVIMKGGTRWAT